MYGELCLETFIDCVILDDFTTEIVLDPGKI